MSAKQPLFIEKGKEQPTALDFNFLRRHGIDLLQRLSGDTWTDFNLHDPGVTLLELLCFSITDLAYRTGFPIREILSDKNGKIDLEDNAFFLKETILTTNPVTIKDFRKIILDELDELDNVWIEPLLSVHGNDALKGLYRITVQVNEEVAGQVDTEDRVKDIKNKVRQCFVSKRNLCEDAVSEVVILESLRIKVEAEVEVADDMVPEKILADISRKLSIAINPKVTYYSESAMLEKGYSLQEIYAGPLLEKGFIPDDEFIERKEKLDPIDLIKAVSDVEGVVHVKQLSVIVPGFPAVQVPFCPTRNRFLLLDADDIDSTIKLFKSRHQVHIRKPVFRDAMQKVKDSLKRYVPPLHTAQNGNFLNSFYRNIDNYYSLQKLLPAVYGVGEEGLSSHVPESRKAQAKQLKAYLLFFEQIIANYLAQLANTRFLFSINAVVENKQTYFYQPLYNVPGIQKILKAYTDAYPQNKNGDWEAFKKDPENGYIKFLRAAMESDDNYCERKNKVLDHLLARFNEQVNSLPVVLYDNLYSDAEDSKRVDNVVLWKAEILGNIVQLGRDRIRAFNYLHFETDADEPGFKKRISTLLYIRNTTTNLRLAEVFDRPEITLQKEQKEPVTYRQGEEARKENVSLKLDMEAAVRAAFDEGQVMENEEADTTQGNYVYRNQKLSFFRYGMDINNYLVGPDPHDKGDYMVLFKEPLEEKWRIVSRHPDESSAMSALKKSIKLLKDINIQSEGFHLVEHILLRPSLDDAVFGFRFCETEKDVLLKHDHWMTFGERDKTISEIIASCMEDRYEDVSKNWENCQVQLYRDKEYPFWVNPGVLSRSEKDALSGEFDRICKKLRLYKEQKRNLYPRFEMLVKGKGLSAVREDFFNFKMTVVFPSWPARFQDANFRSYAEDLIAINTPAHIRLVFRWLNISNMRSFEQLYFNWLQSLDTQRSEEDYKESREELIAFLNGNKPRSG